MGMSIANQLPPSNAEDDFSNVEALVIHGPSWTNWMVFDTHARSVIMPMLIKSGWTMRVSQALRRIDAVTPWAPEALQ